MITIWSLAFHLIITIITNRVFHKHYYDEVAQVKYSLSRSDGDSNRLLTSWRFIPHTNHTHPLKWATDHRTNYSGKVSSLPGTTVSRGCPIARTHLGLTIAPPCPTTPALVQCVADNLLSPNNFLASRSKGTLFDQLNVRHAFNMTRGTTTIGP
jgi:hypothetical protein